MKKSRLLLIGISLFTSQIGYAGGFKIALQGQKQIGMGSAGVGFAQDAATIYFNPAGMSFIQNQVNAGVTGLFPSTSFLDRGTNTLYNAVNQMFTPLSLYGTASLSKSVKFGLGVYTPFGSGVRYPYEWAGRYILDEIELQTIFIQPTVSFKLSNNFSIGGGFIYSTGHVILQRDLPLTGQQQTEPASARLTGDAEGFGFNLGAYFKASEKLHLGATYHSNVNMKVKTGKALFTNIPTPLSATFPLSNSFSSELALPSEVAVGLSYKLSKKLTMAVDFNHTFWSSFDSLGFDYGINTSAVTDAKSPRLYENASAIRIGAQYAAHKNIDLRAGFFFDQTPVADAFVAPELPDNDKIGLSAGATFRVDQRFHIDLSLLYENVPDRTVKNKETGLEGTYQTKVLAPGIGLTYMFQQRTTKRKNY